MFATITKAYDTYVSEFTAFTKWLKTFSEIAEKNGKKFSPMEHLDKGDWEKYNNWGVQLVGMETALGLTSEEVARVELQIGFRNKRR
jgi:hypothetical protein